MDEPDVEVGVGLKRRESCWSFGASILGVELAMDQRSRSLRSGIVELEEVTRATGVSLREMSRSILYAKEIGHRSPFDFLGGNLLLTAWQNRIKLRSLSEDCLS